MHSLIWKNSIIAESIDDAKEDISHPSLSPELASRISSFLEATKSPQTDKDIRKAHSKKMHSLLRQVDPEMAGKWHVHDDRKIRRSLQVYYTTGTKHSDTLRLQEKNVPRYLFTTFNEIADLTPCCSGYGWTLLFLTNVWIPGWIA